MLARHSDAFSPQVGFTSRLAHRMRPPTSSSAQQRPGAPGAAALGLRMQEGGTGGGEGEQEETVEITREELKELAEQAGIRVQIGETPLSGDAVPPPQAAQQPPPNNFQPLIDAAAPILELPPILKYPIFLVATGLASSILLPLFGSSSIGDMTGRAAEQPAEVSAPKEAAAPKKAEKAKISAEAGGNEKKESQGGLFPDLSNLAPPPEELKMNKSCDKWPWSLTPTCSDPDIANKAILKNLDQYTKPNPEVRKMRDDFEARQKAQREALQAEREAKKAAKAAAAAGDSK